MAEEKIQNKLKKEKVNKQNERKTSNFSSVYLICKGNYYLYMKGNKWL